VLAACACLFAGYHASFLTSAGSLLNELTISG
jgi:hypothetical protein